MLDLHTHQPIEVLPDREADTLAEWLKGHPEIQVITRDRFGPFAEGAARGAPQATQCADRWHLWSNLGDAVEKVVVAHRACLHEPENITDASANSGDGQAEVAVEDASVEPPGDDAGPDHAVDHPVEDWLETRFRERHMAIQALHAQGKSMRAITRELRLDRKTVRRFLRADSVEELLARTRSRVTLLDEHRSYVSWRWSQGCTDVTRLFDEIRERGYRGSMRTVYRYL